MTGTGFVVTSALLLLFGLFHGTSGALGRYCSLDDMKNHVYLCGSEWPEMLSMICYPEGVNRVEKRSVHSASDKLRTIQDNLAGTDDDRNTLENPLFLPKSRAVAYIKPEAKRTIWLPVDGKNMFQGAACECCHNRCEIREIAQYCVNPQGALQNLGLGRK